MTVRISGLLVRGAVVDDQSRCVHYRTALDVVALRFRCCGDWYPCVHCHDETVSHPRVVWEPESGDVHAALCGACGTTMSIAHYRLSAACPACGAGFNPGCARHHALYFG
jgi:uncharacterized CHY-type Zn-finger protein